MNKIFVQNFESAFGELILGSYNDQLCLCDWKYRKMRKEIDKRITIGLDAEYIVKESEIISSTITQLTEYVNKKRTVFDIPLIMVGSEFQKIIWNELLKIPYGKTETYLDLSKKIHNEKAIRAVATANGANSISIIIPCHRIIGSKGEMVGYAGGLEIKKKLLELESGKKTPIQLRLFD